MLSFGSANMPFMLWEGGRFEKEMQQLSSLPFPRVMVPKPQIWTLKEKEILNIAIQVLKISFFSFTPASVSFFYFFYKSKMIFLKILFIYFLERREGREKEMERKIIVQEIYQLVASHTPRTGDLAFGKTVLCRGYCTLWGQAHVT